MFQNHLFPTMKDNELEIIQAEFKEEKTVKAFETQAVYCKYFCCCNGVSLYYLPYGNKLTVYATH